MTYPPQQPGPGGWEQQPAGNPPGGAPDPGPAGTPQQQPTWYGNQHTGWGMQPIQGQPQPGQQPFPPQPGQQDTGSPQFPPPPDWGGGEFGQSTWMQDSDGFAADTPRKKSRLPWIFGGVGVLVVAGGIGAGMYLYSGGPGAAKPVAEEVVGKVNSHDFAGLGPLLCQSHRAELEGQLDQLSPGRFDLRLVRVTENGEQARAQLTGTYVMDGANQPVEQTMGLAVEDGAWKVCDLDQ